jgi:hypothetical protein
MVLRVLNHRVPLTTVLIRKLQVKSDEYLSVGLEVCYGLYCVNIFRGQNTVRNSDFARLPGTFDPIKK